MSFETVEPFLKSDDVHERNFGLMRVQEDFADEAFPYIREAAADENPWTRTAAARALPLTNLSTDEHRVLLERLLQDPHPMVPRKLLETLQGDAFIQKVYEHDELFEQALESEDELVRFAAVELIRKNFGAFFRSDFVRRHLPPLFESPSPVVRLAVIEAMYLSHTYTAKSLPFIRRALHDDYWHVRREALLMVGALGPAALPLRPEVEKLLQDSDVVVRMEAQGALKVLDDPKAEMLPSLVDGEMPDPPGSGEKE